MTIRKQLPLRDYDTFPSSTSSQAEQGTSETPSTTDTDKSRLSAAQEAQRLASQGSWADNVFQTPGATLTPPSTVDEEEHSQMGRPEELYHSDPPPEYTPSDTAASTIPNSPAAQRTVPVRSGLPLQTSSHTPRRRASTPPSSEDPEGEGHQPGRDTSAPTSPLLQRDDQDGHHEPVRWGQGCKKEPTPRFKRLAWLTVALFFCLWLMVSSLFIDNPVTRTPHHPHSPHDHLDDSPIPTWPIPKREYRQHETSHSIHGTFALYDLLDLETTSGSISVTIDLKPGEKPAVMRLKTMSGSINIKMVDASWLTWKPAPTVATNRTLNLDLSTKAGSVNGNVLVGNGGTTTISTQSGSQGVTIYPVGVGKCDNATKISTSTGSGSQRVKVVSSAVEDVFAIEAKHLATGSGSLMIEYPETWMGKVHAHLGGSGHVYVSGTDLEKSGGGRDIYAWRGEKKDLDNLREIEVRGRGSGSLFFKC